MLLSLQKWPRQAAEDALIDFPPDQTDVDIDDLDSLANTPAPEEEEPSKFPSSDPIRDWTDDDDDGCRILEVYDPTPLSFTFALDSTSANPAAQVVDTPPPH